MNFAPLAIPGLGIAMLLLAVLIEGTGAVQAGASGRMGRLLGSVILLLAAGAVLVLVLDMLWSQA